jgi:HAMP domain-containing protein
MLFINRSGEFVYGEAFDLINGKEIPVPQSLEQHISVGSLLLNHPAIRSTINGILVLPDQPMFISSWPVLTNEGEGPIQGSLIMGRYLDDLVIKRITTITQLKVTAHLLNDPKLPGDYQKAIASLSEGTPIFVQPLNTTDVGGYALLNDIYGTPSLVIRVDTPRAIYAQGIAIMNSFFIVLLVIGLTSVGITLLLVEKVVLFRLNKLRMSVKTIGLHKDLAARVEEPRGNDEVSELTHAINGMLEQLQKSQEDLNRLACSLHETNENHKTKIDELERYKTLTIDRELRMIELKKEVDELCKKFGEKLRYDIEIK